MIRENNHNDGIVGLTPAERDFRSQYKLRNGHIKGATRAYQQSILSDNKKTRLNRRRHIFAVLGQCTPELEIQLMCEQLEMEVSI